MNITRRYVGARSAEEELDTLCDRLGEACPTSPRWRLRTRIFTPDTSYVEGRFCECADRRVDVRAMEEYGAAGQTELKVEIYGSAPCCEDAVLPDSDI